MKLVVGLGNPGRKYEGTRHNVGFEVVHELARRAAAGTPKSQFDAEALDVTVAGERLILLCPQMYMNRSGSSVQRARDFYKLQNEQVLVVCDDFALPIGKLRLRAQGSAGGQKGLDDTIRCLGTDAVPRLRLGIGPLPENWDPADFVLGKLSKDERAEMAFQVPRAADAVGVWASQGIGSAMAQFN
ncbi:MAG: aminoacyl-tRNA hydrolase [Planctomycetes bacterium]|nr:aminoacyl-tRNA hydrolase [Planctomycetota bacterium]